MSADELQKIAKRFSSLGWIGFWIQAVLILAPIGMLAVVLLRKAQGPDVRLDFTDYLAIVGLVVLLFTTLWSFRYTRLAKRIADPATCPSYASLSRTLWTGLWAGIFGIAISVVLILIDVVRLVFLFLKTPQGGVPVIRTEAQSRSEWVSAIDAISLLTDICTLVGELVIVGFTLWLLFIITRRASEFAQLPNASAATR
jgi:hypothetical protein